MPLPIRTSSAAIGGTSVRRCLHPVRPVLAAGFAESTRRVLAPAIIADNGKAALRITKAVMVGHEIDYNLYSGKIAFDLGEGRMRTSLAEWRSASSNDTHSIEGDPGFVDAAANDYSITTSSPAVDAGLDLRNEGVVDDIKGTSRPQGGGFDVGAYEAGG